MTSSDTDNILHKAIDRQLVTRNQFHLKYYRIYKCCRVLKIIAQLHKRTLSLILLLFFLNLQFYGQVITGTVVDALNNEPLVYASIGVIETTIGTITDEEGHFNLETKGSPDNSQVRISMIGFKSKTYAIEELSNKDNILRLESEAYKLPEIIITPSGKIRKVGTTSYTFKGGLCGWGGTQTGKGWEVGTKLELGDLPVRMKNLNVRVKNHSYDSTLFRLHIRNIVDNMPENELISKNILISFTKKTGWVTIDLSKHNLVLEGEIALSLEWIKIFGTDNKDLITINREKQFAAGVTISKKQNHGCLYTKWGTEAKWVRYENDSPSIYLTVQ